MRLASGQAAHGGAVEADADRRTSLRAPYPLQPSLAVLLREGFHWFMDRLNDEATAAGEPRLSAAAAIVVSHLHPEGSRAAEIARTMGVTRQHVHAVVRELRDAGVVDTVPDPASRRDRLIVPTAEGEIRRRRAVARIAELEAKLAESIGATDLERLHAVLDRIWGPGARSSAGRPVPIPSGPQRTPQSRARSA